MRRGPTPPEMLPPAPLPRVPIICITGGPCAGKSTAIPELARRLWDRHQITVYQVPEAATLFFSNGVNPSQLLQEGRGSVMWARFQRAIYETQISLETSFEAIARAAKIERPLILADRGLLDNAAYLTPTDFLDNLQKLHLTYREAGERYAAVLHLETAAVLGEDVYEAGRTAVRRETATGAIQADILTQHAWSGHERLFIVKARASWEAKMDEIELFTVAAYHEAMLDR